MFGLELYRCYCAAVVIGRITDLARSSVRLVWALNAKTSMRRKAEIGVNVPQSSQYFVQKLKCQDKG